MTFWERVRRYANERVKAAYMAKYHLSMRCSVCDTWNSEVGGFLAQRSDDPSYDFYDSQCKRCKQWTRWDQRNGLISIQADTQPELKRVK